MLVKKIVQITNKHRLSFIIFSNKIMLNILCFFVNKVGHFKPN